MSLKNFSEKKHNHLTAKKNCFNIRVTTFITGGLKNKFIDDAIQRNDMEASHARNIIALYYEVMEAHPQLKEKEFSEIKTFFIKR